MFRFWLALRHRFWLGPPSPCSDDISDRDSIGRGAGLAREVRRHAAVRGPARRATRCRPRVVVAVISVAMLGGGRDAAAYYLRRDADCPQGSYYLHGADREGRWLGCGPAALGLDGPVTGISAEAFSSLLDGRLPDGTQVAKPVMRTDPRALLPAAPMVAELDRAATDTGQDLAGLLGDGKLAGAAVTLAGRVERARARDNVTVDAGTVADVCAMAALNPHAIYPPDPAGKGGFAEAFTHVGEKVDVRRCGLDLVVSPPKSVSVRWALAEPDVAAGVLAAHEDAVTQVVDYFNRHTSHGLRGHQGDGMRAARIDSDGLLVAAFTHVTSRADDPQLHTHLVIPNLVRGRDGKWTAVDSRAVHRHARTAGCLYQAVLRGELTRTLGVEWGPVRKGVAELTAIPASLRRLFSTRRAAIEAELDRTGLSGRRAAQRAAYRTRTAKTHTPEQPLRVVWLAKAAGHLRRDPRELVTRALHAIRPPIAPDRAELAAMLLGPAGLTAKTTSFDRREVLQALTEAIPTGLPVTGAQLETVADQVLRDDDAIPLLQPALDTGERRWTTVELLEVETAALKLAHDITGVRPLDAVTVARAVDGLRAEQRDLAAALLTSDRGVDVVVGPAGSGKTATLRAVAAGWTDVGVPMLGCAVAAVTARRLEAATGITSCSTAKLLADLDTKAAHLPTGTGVVVDEASMVGTRDLHRLLTHTHRAGGKLVLVGDPAQLPETDAGGLFAALATHATPLTLTRNQRQEHGWEAKALLDLRDGHIDAALDTYIARDRVHVLPTVELTRSQIAHQYLQRLNAGAAPGDVVVLASTRDDVTALNDIIRRRLRLAGHLPNVGVTIGDGDTARRYAVGDLVLVTRNDHRRGLLNGTRASVTAASRQTLSLRTADGDETTVPTAWAVEHLDHGYAMTVHKAQGLTCTSTLTYGTAALCQQAGYVALSRGVTDNHLFTAHPLLTPDLPGVHVDDEPSRFRLLTMSSPEAVLDNLAERLTVARQHTLASSQQPQIQQRPAFSRDDDYPRRWHDDHHSRGLGRSR